MGESGEKDGEAQTFESAMRELEGIVHELEAGDTGLEAAITAYERGVKLKKFCEDKLRQAELRVEKIDGNSGGAAGTEPFETG
jgi:exodeoxyribonuclease VII small subunit